VKEKTESAFFGKSVVVVKLDDEKYPSDFLNDFGKWDDRELEFVVDTKRGFVLGEELEEPEEPWEDDFEDPDEFEEAYALWDARMIVWEDCPYECLYETGFDYEARSYRYWHPENGLLEWWANACKLEDAEERKREKSRVAEQAGKLYARIKDYGNGWSYLSMTVSIKVDSKKVGSASLSGIESDTSLDDIKELISTLLFDAIAESGKFLIVDTKELDNKVSEIAEEVFYG